MDLFKVLDFVNYFVLLDCFPLFLNFLACLINLLFGTQGRLRTLKVFYKQEMGDTGVEAGANGLTLMTMESPMTVALPCPLRLGVRRKLTLLNSFLSKLICPLPEQQGGAAHLLSCVDNLTYSSWHLDFP